MSQRTDAETSRAAAAARGAHAEAASRRRAEQEPARLRAEIAERKR